ncbi:MAG: SdpI family protein [Patescibacteria group bacterium]|nr:MAG: SdpI family protein [Patescibacteria group bacterium]
MTRKTFIAMCALLLASAAASVIFYPAFPEEYASHWNMAGEVDDTMPKSTGALFMPGIMLVLLGLYALIPRIDPLKENLEKFRRAYDLLWLALFSFFAYVHALTLFWNLGGRFSFVRFLTPAFAVLWYVIGVVLARSRRNWFVGIRTPWTLASDDVWNDTHAFGAKLFKATAVVSLLGVFLPAPYVFWFIVAPVLLTSLATVLYSYLAWRRRAKR